MNYVPPDSLPSWHKLLGVSEILPGEDQAAYSALSRLIDAAIAQVDVIDELRVANYRLGALDVLRLRRTKLMVQKRARIRSLKTFLLPRIDVGVEETLLLLQQRNQLKGAEVDEDLAEFYSNNPFEASEALHEWLASHNLSLKELETRVRGTTAWEFAKLYARGDAWAVKWIDGLLEEAALTFEDLITSHFEEIMDYLDHLDRLDRLIAAAEAQQNATLREIERRHAALGSALRRVQILHGELKLIEASSTKDAA